MREASSFICSYYNVGVILIELVLIVDVACSMCISLRLLHTLRFVGGKITQRKINHQIRDNACSCNLSAKIGCSQRVDGVLYNVQLGHMIHFLKFVGRNPGHGSSSDDLAPWQFLAGDASFRLLPTGEGCHSQF